MRMPVSTVRAVEADAKGQKSDIHINIKITSLTGSIVFIYIWTPSPWGGRRWPGASCGIGRKGRRGKEARVRNVSRFRCRMYWLVL